MRDVIRGFLVLALGLFGCSQPEGARAWMEDSSKIKVLSTTAMIDDLVGAIGGEWIDHATLIRGEIDPHSYELVKGDEEKISFAKIVFKNGLGLEHGASLNYQLQRHPCAVALGSAILEKAGDALIRVDGEIDPHIWLDISLWSQVIDPIVETLSRVDPAHASEYQSNGEKLREKMLHKHKQLVLQFHAVSSKVRYLVTSHDAFNYFTRAYLAEEAEKKTGEWKKRFAAPEGLAPDGQLSASDIQKIVDHLFRYKITRVFPESNVNRDSLKKIVRSCAEMGLEVKLSTAVLYGDAIGSLSGYLQMIEHNSKVLLQEWEKSDE